MNCSYFKFGAEGDEQLQDIIWDLFHLHPNWNLSEFSAYLYACDIPADPHFVARVFRSWLWSWKLPSRTQLLKYTVENMQYYFQYISESYHFPWDRLKFADECHFVSRQLYRRRQLAPIGQRAHAINCERLDASLTITLLTDLTKDPCLFLRFVSKIIIKN